MNDITPTDDTSDNTIGNEVQIHFTSVGNKTTAGKVDTGATTSSLHATDVTINKERNSVTFRSPAISDNLVTMDMDGIQAVHSADGGEQERPTVKFDIEINNTPIQGALFNLNDRSNMDSMVLIGQNVLKAGKFQIDVSKDDVPEENGPTNESKALSEALQLIFDSNITLTELISHFKYR